MLLSTRQNQISSWGRFFFPNFFDAIRKDTDGDAHDVVSLLLGLTCSVRKLRDWTLIVTAFGVS